MAKLNDTLLANEARANFYQILDEVNTHLRQFTVTLRGKARAVIMSAEEYEGWLETLELMADRKASMGIEQAVRDLDEGKGIPWKKAKKQLGW
ncbi:hypothetical protein A2W24_00135 [Microgenomates group bacterium RBG_16_45_19]|nr:MAG: hypothetical protein A2W24_00135 [Microgenomates group bacterium RBG_16_45_19]